MRILGRMFPALLMSNPLCFADTIKGITLCGIVGDVKRRGLGGNLCIFLLLAAAGVGLALYFLGSQLWALAGRFFAQEETEIYLEQALYNCCQAAERMLGFPAERMQQTVMTQVRVMMQDMK